MVLLKNGLLYRAVVAGCMAVMIWSCGKSPVTSDEVKTGSLEMQVQLSDGLGKRQAACTTEFDSLIIEVSASDMKTVRTSTPVNKQELFTIDTVADIPVGSGRMVKVFTVNKAGEVLHEDSSGVRTVKVEPNMITVVSVMLLPLKGSIYLQIAGIPSAVDSVVALFIGENGTSYRVCSVRSSKMYFSLDGIPHATKGTLTVAGITTANDTLYRARKDIVVNTRTGAAIQLTFEGSPGGLALSGAIVVPAVTMATGSMGSFPVVESERGDVIITEIMYATNDSEYIECFNPGEQQVVFDTLIVDIDGTKRMFANVTIGPKAYYVIGRIPLPWVDVAHSVKSALDLSANGNWITLFTKNGTAIDQVIFTGGSNSLDWPKVTGKQSIALSPLAYSTTGNNLGRNWLAVTESIDGCSSQFGTPHKK